MKKNLIAAFFGALFVLSFTNCNANKSEGNLQGVMGETITQSADFTYIPSEPVNGKKKAVVELGAAGFNLFIIEIDKDKNWKSMKKEFGSSLVSEGMTNAETIKIKLQDYIRSIVDFGVAGKDIHFVVSSGAAKETIIDEITKALKKIGYFVNVVTPEQEAKYAFRCTLPNGYEETAFVVDLGSGNTKVSYMKGDNIIAKETYGAKYFQKGTDDKTVYDDVRGKVADIPSANRRTLFFIGGVPFQMAKMLKKGNERFTVLSTNLSDYDSLAKEEGEKVKAGLNIYKAILDETNVPQVVFDWDANFTIGFLLGLKY